MRYCISVVANKEFYVEAASYEEAEELLLSSIDYEGWGVDEVYDRTEEKMDELYMDESKEIITNDY